MLYNDSSTTITMYSKRLLYVNYHSYKETSLIYKLDYFTGDDFRIGSFDEVEGEFSFCIVHRVTRLVCREQLKERMWERSKDLSMLRCKVLTEVLTE